MNFEMFGPIKFHQKGKNPQLVILSGTHGDETRVTPDVTKVVEAMYDDLPSFLYIPEVSPSAAQQHSRYNQYGHDVNRSFSLEGDVEISSLKLVLNRAKKATAVTFHEDLQFGQFYLYDSGLVPNEILYPFYEKLQVMSVPIYSGPDDPEDVNLGYTSRNGYIEDAKKEDGILFLDEWAVNSGIFSRCFTVEMPMNYAEQLVLTAVVMQFVVEVNKISTT